MRALLIAAVQVLALGSIALSKSQPVALKSAQLVDSSHGWAANEHQVFWTADAGAHWKDITPPNSSRAQISSVFFLDNFAGWVFSAVPGSDPNGEPDFQIAFSDNAGSTWNSERLLRSRLVPNWQNAGSDADIDFVDRRHGWMDLSLVGSPAVAPGILLRTSDGGKSWTPVPTAPHIRGKVRFIDEQNGWLAGGADNEHLFATHDGGKTWKNIALKPPADVNPSSYGQYAPPVFVSARHGYLPVTYSTPGIDHSTLVTFHTVDSGNTWTAKGVVPNAGQSQIEAPTAIVDSTIITASTYRQNDSARVTKLGATGLPVESTVPLERVKGAVVSHLSFATESQGWMLTSHGLLATKDGGATWIDITPQQEPKRLPNAKGDQRSLVTTSPTYRQSVFLPGGFGRLPQTEHRNLMRSRTSSSSASTLASSFQFGTADSVHIGFDRCVLPEPDQMSVWWQESPYFDVGVYLGGDSMHCAVTATKGRVTEIRSQGWGVVPLWVGLQAPCTEFGNRFPYDTTLAEFDGSDQADQAYAQALNVGLDGTIIYYDLEIYDAAQPDCVAAVNAFLDGWISELHEFGFLAGVYGNPAPAATWWAGSTVPDDAWIAKYDARATLWGMGYGTTDDMWSPNKRIHQYSNTHFETWGTTRLDIDNDIFYADLVQGTGTKPYSFAIGDLAIGIAPIANGINTQCVGLCGMENGPAIDDIVGQDGAHSFIVSNQGSGELPDCEDSVWTWAWGINFAREIVGECAGPGGQFGFLISSGGSVGTIGGFTSAYGINDDHQIVGYVNDAQGTHGLIQANGLRMLDFGNGSSTTANGINGASQIVGTYYDSDGYAHGYLYTNWYPSGSGSFYTIDYPGANETYVQGINNNGQIVGWYYTDDWAVILGFFYDPQLGFVNIDHNNPDDITSWTVIDGINDTGKIVGAYVWCDDCNAKSIVGDPF